MKDQLITPKTALLASQKGYSPILLGYRFTDDLPTQSLLQRWLREEHSIWVIVDLNFPQYLYAIRRIGKEITLNSIFDSYEKALEEGLQQALKLIKE